MFEVFYVVFERRKGIFIWVVVSCLLLLIMVIGVVEKYIIIEFYNGYKY